MRLLLDENLPRSLKREFPEHEISTVRENGWSGKKNGELIRLMIENQFDALITFDRNIQHQQNFERDNVAVILLTATSNKHATLTPLIPRVKSALRSLQTGVIVIQEK